MFLFHELGTCPWCHLRVAIQPKTLLKAPDDFGGAIYTALDCNESAMEKSRSLFLGKHVFLFEKGRGERDNPPVRRMLARGKFEGIGWGSPNLKKRLILVVTGILDTGANPTCTTKHSDFVW